VLIRVHSWHYFNVIANLRVWKCCCNIHFSSALSVDDPRCGWGFLRTSKNGTLRLQSKCERVAVLVSHLQLPCHLCEQQVSTRSSEQLCVDMQPVRLLDLSSTPEPQDEQNSTPRRCYVPADNAKFCPVAEISGYLAHFKYWKEDVSEDSQLGRNLR